MNMRWLWNPCRRHQANLCLLAAGTLSEPEAGAVRAHLADCADCRNYHDEIMSLARPLADWEANFAQVMPTQDVQMRWAKAVQAAANAKSIRQTGPENILFDSWQELIWPCRGIWTGLAAVWVLIFVFIFSQRDPTERMAQKAPPPSPEMILAFRQQQRLLAELIGSSETRAAEPPPKPFSPQPRSEGCLEILMT